VCGYVCLSIFDESVYACARGISHTSKSTWLPSFGLVTADFVVTTHTLVVRVSTTRSHYYTHITTLTLLHSHYYTHTNKHVAFIFTFGSFLRHARKAAGLFLCVIVFVKCAVLQPLIHTKLPVQNYYYYVWLWLL